MVLPQGPFREASDALDAAPYRSLADDERTALLAVLDMHGTLADDRLATADPAAFVLAHDPSDAHALAPAYARYLYLQWTRTWRSAGGRGPLPVVDAEAHWHWVDASVALDRFTGTGIGLLLPYGTQPHPVSYRLQSLADGLAHRVALDDPAADPFGERASRCVHFLRLLALPYASHSRTLEMFGRGSTP